MQRDRQASAADGSVLSGARLLEAIPCPDCGLANAVERKFCANCGRMLWEPCLSCATANGALEKFCGVCGANLSELVRHRIESFESLWEQAQRLQTLFRHGEAIGMLKQAPRLEHPRLATYARQCQERARELQAELEHLELKRHEHFAEAQQSFTEHRYEDAAAALERIHRRLREPAMQELLERVRGILEELPALEQEIRQALQERRTQDLLPKVQRYVELKPEDRPMGELLLKLRTLHQRQLEAHRNQLLKAAKEKLAEHAYAAAATLVGQVDPLVRTPEVEKFWEYCQNRADEVAFLQADLRQCALVDEHLLPLAERLKKLRPNDESVAELVQGIGQLHRRHASTASGTLRRCLPAKRPSPLGCAIEALEGFRVIDDQLIRSCEAYTQNYTSFYVACGLALQGLERAAVSINLLPERKKGLLGSLTTPLLRKRPKAAWGIHLGNYGLKAVKLGSQGEHDQAVALACDYLPHSEPLTHAVSAETQIRATLEKFLQRNPLGDEALCISYPVAKTLARFLTLPPADEKKIPDLIQYEARQQIPFPLESVTWDYQLVSSGDEEGLKAHEACLFALKTDEAAQYLFPWQELKLKVDVLQAENVALHNLLAFDYYAAFHDQFCDANESPRQQVLAVLDIGATSTNVLIGNQYSLWSRNIPLGSHHFNKPLVTEFKLTQSQAEQLKRKPTLAAFTSKLYRAIDPLVRQLQDEVRRSLSYFEHTYRGRRIRQMLIVGGGIRMHGLLRLLRSGAAEQDLEA
jgi:type IV pilus assembly protein PilM